MIPIMLSLQGIYSYQSKQTIDFTRLTEAHIFGIFGAVGSGKSTILEAITFALYGKTDRLNLSGDNRNYNMMNLRSNDLVIEFIFSTGKDNAEYMATVRGRRNSKQFEDVKTLDRAAYQKTNGNWQPIGVETLEKLIGLSYENFKRTIIIPQGKFQEFLQLGDKDRTQMMKELFNLNKYEMFYKVVSLETQNNQQIQHAEGQLQQLGEVSPQQIKETEEYLKKIKEEIEYLVQQLSDQQKRAETLQQLQEKVNKIKELEKTAHQLKVQEPEINFLEKTIGEYEYCRLHFENLLSSSADISKKILQIEQSIGQDHTLEAEVSQQIRESSAILEKIKPEYDEKEKLKQMAEELMKVAKLHELATSCHLLNERILKGEKVHTETVQKIAQLRLSHDALSSSIKSLKEQCPDMTVLSKAREWHTINIWLVNVRKDMQMEMQSIQKDMEKILLQVTVLWKEDCFSEISSADLKEAIFLLDQKKEERKQLIRDLDIEISHMNTQVRLEEYASQLREGEACPLCGSLSHPHVLDAQNISETLEKINHQRNAYDNDITNIEQAQKKLSEAVTNLHLKKELLDNVLLKHNEHNHKIETHQTSFVWKEYEEESHVQKAFIEAEMVLQKIKENETALEKIVLGIEDEMKNKEKYYLGIEDLKHQLTALSAERSTLAGQIRLINPEEFENKPLSVIQLAKETFLKKYAEIEVTYQAATGKIASLAKTFDTVSGRLEANRQIWQQELSMQKNIHATIHDKLAQSPYTSLTEVEKILAQHLDVETVKKKVGDFRQSLDFVQQHLATLHQETENKEYDAELHQHVLASIARTMDDLKLKNQLLGKNESDLKKLRADVEIREKLQKSVARLNERSEDIRTLKQLFKANGFVNYISSVYLHELCHTANERFYKLTRQKLSLELTEGNNFQVRDFMNGGKLRSVKTLSGGQIFQAALSLALALSDNIRKFSESHQNFFFLDEGFGSLDKESLSIVFDTLKSLRKENRIVGIISHVEEMQQEIDSHLRIVNDEEKGSLVISS
jgi:DNA repair protein SbcC/Rad50